MARGINKETIFKQAREKNYIKRLIREHLQKHEIEIYAYCVMPNHIHLIIKSHNISELSIFIAKVLAKYAEYYNYKHQRNGHVFQNRYRSECIENSKYFWACLRYIHLNPVKANITKDALRYKYSSMKEYFLATSDIIHDKGVLLYQRKFACEQDFINFHQQTSRDIFVDTDTDLAQQQGEIALSMLYQCSTKWRLEFPAEVIENAEYRQLYKEELRKILGISKKQTDLIYEKIKAIAQETI